MTAVPRPHAWIAVHLPRPHELEGYAEAVAKVARGESLFPDEVRRVPVPRVLRSVESLTLEHDHLLKLRARIIPADSGDTAGARLNAAGMIRHYKHTDNQLARYARLTGRIDALKSRIAKRT